jgi:hypothetical protein
MRGDDPERVESPRCVAGVGWTPKFRVPLLAKPVPMGDARLAGGLLSGKFGRDATGASGRRDKFDFPPVDKERAWRVIDVIRPIAAAHDVSVAAIALAWLLHQDVVTSVIIGAKWREQLADNLRAPDVVLTADELKALGEVSALPAEYPGWMLAFQSGERTPGGMQPKS